MRKVVRIILGLGILGTLIAVLGVSSAVTPEAQAAGCVSCRCVLGIQETGETCVDNTTCASATSLLHATLENSVGCESFCISDLIITMPCTPNGGGGYWVCGKLQYQCEVCIDKCF